MHSITAFSSDLQVSEGSRPIRNGGWIGQDYGVATRVNLQVRSSSFDLRYGRGTHVDPSQVPQLPCPLSQTICASGSHGGAGGGGGTQGGGEMVSRQSGGSVIGPGCHPGVGGASESCGAYGPMGSCGRNEMREK